MELHFRKLMGSIMLHGLDRERWSWWLRGVESDGKGRVEGERGEDN